MKIEIKVPQAGESVTEAMISEWFMADGDIVEKDEAIPYTRDIGGRFVPVTPYGFDHDGASAIRASALDLMRFARAFWSSFFRVFTCSSISR